MVGNANFVVFLSVCGEPFKLGGFRGCKGAEPPRGCKGAEPPWGFKGAEPPWGFKGAEPPFAPAC